VDKTWVDEGCYNTLYSKETLKAAIHPDQGADLQTACTFTRYNCYQNQVVNQ
jgi:hypothetical protein